MTEAEDSTTAPRKEARVAFGKFASAARDEVAAAVAELGRP